MTLGEIVQLLQAQFDATVATTPICEQFANERLKRCVAESLWRAAEVSLGPTVAGQSRYPLAASDPVDVRLLFTGTFAAPSLYTAVGQTDLLKVRDTSWGAIVTGPGAGVFAFGSDAAGAAFIDLEPVPSVSGLALVGLAPIQPAVWTSGQQAPIPADFHMGLFFGVKADLHLFVNEREDLAAANEQRFETMVAKLRGRKNSRIGSGPTRVGVSVGGR